MWVKICGIRDDASLHAAVAAGADAIGLNFYTPSPRYVEAERAAELVAQLPAAVRPVGLFVNETPTTIVEICKRCEIDLVQLHGDEPPELLDELRQRAPELQIIRAFRVGKDGLADVENFLRQIVQFPWDLFAFLIDARVENVYGGSGQQAPWELLVDDARREDWPPLILAGGLTPENVRSAIETVNPWGVDVAGGVESSPGVKDKTRSEQFVRNARTP